MSEIIDIHGRQILDSRGNPTVEVDVTLADGSFGRAAVPSGASTGVHEAWELRDGDKSQYLRQRRARRRSRMSTTSSPKELLGWDALDQTGIDRRMIELDGTENKKNLGRQRDSGRVAGGGACGGGVQRAAAVSLSGRAGGAAVAGADDEHRQRRRACRQRRRRARVHGHAAGLRQVQRRACGPASRSFISLKKCCKSKKLNTDVGDEGGFAPDLKSNAEALDLIVEAIQKAGYKPGEQIAIALDVAATEFYDEKTKKYSVDGRRTRLRRRWSTVWPPGSRSIRSARSKTAAPKTIGKAGRCSASGWATRCSWSATICSSPTPSGCKRGIDEHIANSILIKVNQIGTLTETIEAIQLAHRNGYTSIASHRSGETEDSTIADLAVALATGQIKTGSGFAHRSHGEVQSIAADRGAIGRIGDLRRAAVQKR